MTRSTKYGLTLLLLAAPATVLADGHKFPIHPSRNYPHPEKVFTDPADSTKSNDSSPGDLTGLWNLTLTPDPSDPDAPPPFHALFTATALRDWMTTETDEQVTTQGRWDHFTNGQYQLTGWQFEFTGGAFDGTFKFRATVNVSAGSKSLQGVFQVDVYDPSGVYQGSGVGKLTGVRLDVEPLP